MIGGVRLLVHMHNILDCIAQFGCNCFWKHLETLAEGSNSLTLGLGWQAWVTRGWWVGLALLGVGVMVCLWWLW